MTDLPIVDINDPDFWQDIYPALHEALAVSPVGRTPDGLLYVLGYDEMDTVLKDKRFGTFDQLGLMGVTSGRVWEWWQRVMFSNNDPVHGRLRRMVNRAFTPGPIDRKRDTIRRISRELVAEAVAKESVDVMSTVAHDLPSMVMASLLAIPESDREQFADWTTDIGLAFGAAGDPVVWQRVEDALANLDAYVEKLIEQRRGQLGDDLLSELIAAEEAGDKLSTQELIDLVENLLFAGHDTTRGSAGVLLHLMADHPEMIEAVRADDQSVKGIVEEILRYEAIAFSTCRSANQPADVAGIEVEAGTPVALCLPAACRDQRKYADPDRFDINRREAPQPAFGAGAHYCIGAWLARAELQELLRASAEMLSGVTVEAAPRWVPFAQIRRYEALQLRFAAV